jgi:hypothetical protein
MKFSSIDFTMMYKNEPSQIASSGLRYTVKENGSAFQGMGQSGETLSCIKCGQHKLRRNGVFKRYPTALMFYCVDCKPTSVSKPMPYAGNKSIADL